MPPSLTLASNGPGIRGEETSISGRVLVGCPDARPPAYQAVAGLARAGLLDQFLTGFYFRDGALANGRAGRWALGPDGAGRRILKRRHHPEIPGERVSADWSYDLALAVENRLARHAPSWRGTVARARTNRFDRHLARAIRRRAPDVALVFSDVGSDFALPDCRRRGITSILSMVHGDVREERLVLEHEAQRAPDFFPIYLAEGAVDPAELGWLHERRLCDLALADHVLVPSEHIAGWLRCHGTPAQRITVVPYAADTSRFVPRARKVPCAGGCTFLFAGGITQRKGIKYLLEAWRWVRRPGWRLQLLGGLPANPAPLEPYRDEVEWLGRVGHAEVPAVMAEADVFVFPSLFEGSAVVTYEALACGLPTIVTPAAGSVVRDEIEGLLVPPGEVEPLARAMERLGTDVALRAKLSAAARRRAEAFDWQRYQKAVVETVGAVLLAR